MLGDYGLEKDKFITQKHGLFNFGAARPSGVHAPSACPDGKDGVIVIFNMNQGKATKGWNQIMTLPRRLKLDESVFTVKPPALFVVITFAKCPISVFVNTRS